MNKDMTSKLAKCFDCQHYYDTCDGYAGGCNAYIKYDDNVFRHNYWKIMEKDCQNLLTKENNVIYL